MGLFENSLTEQEEETEPVPKRFWLLLLERCSGSSLARLCSPDQTVQGAVQCLSDRSGHSARQACGWGGCGSQHCALCTARLVFQQSSRPALRVSEVAHGALAGGQGQVRRRQSRGQAERGVYDKGKSLPENNEGSDQVAAAVN